MDGKTPGRSKLVSNIRNDHLLNFRSFRPSNFGKDNVERSLDSIIVASALWTHDEDTQYVLPADGIPHVYAPGMKVTVADMDPLGEKEDEKESTGTSDG